MPSRYLITHGYVATMDDALGDMSDGAVLVEDGKIAAVGRAEDFIGTDAEVIDAAGNIVLPGMVDTHRHVCTSIHRNMSADQSLIEAVMNVYSRYLPPVSAEDLYTTCLVGALEALDCGITTVLDTSDACTTFEHAEANMNALLDSGIRGFFSFGMSDLDYGGAGPGETAHEARLADIVRLQASGNALIRVALGLSPTGTVPFGSTAREIRFADEQGILCNSHAAVLKNSLLAKGLQERADHGLMLPGHVYIHRTAMTDQEWRLVADTGGKVSIAPESEMQMGNGTPPFRACMDHGLDVALSTDSVLAGSPDLLSQMRIGLQMQRCLDNESAFARGAVPTSVPLTVRDALAWGTRNGADALGLADQIGTLTPGKQADIVIISTKRSLFPTSNPLGTVVLHSTGADVDTVMVGGQIRKREGALVGQDLDAIRMRARETFNRVFEGIAKMPPAASQAELKEALLGMERQCRTNFAMAYADGGRATDPSAPATRTLSVTVASSRSSVGADES